MNLQKSFFILVVSVLASGTALAALGTQESLIAQESRKLGTTHTVTRNGAVKAHILTVAGNTMKEFVDSEGQVYAVSWQGRNTPDFDTLFGRYFVEYQVGKATRVRLQGHRFLNLNTPSLHVEQYGMMKNIRGLAYLVGHIPPGIRREDLK